MCEFGFVFSHISSWGSFGWKNGDFICAWCHLATSCIRGSPHQTCFLSQRDLAFCLTTPLHRRNNVWAREPQKSSEKWSKIRSHRDLAVCAGRTRDRKRTIGAAHIGRVSHFVVSNLHEPTAYMDVTLCILYGIFYVEEYCMIFYGPWSWVALIL